MGDKKETKGEKTRRHLLEVSLSLFETKGYNATTMRDIAKEANCSVGLVYRYFSRKELLVLAFYERLADRLEETLSLPENSKVGERFVHLVSEKLRILSPHRLAFSALFSAMFQPGSEIGVFSPHTKQIRVRMLSFFEGVIRGAADAPPEALIGQLARALYISYFLLLLLWLQDPSGKATEPMLVWVQRVVGVVPMGMLMRLPVVRDIWKDLDAIFVQLLDIESDPGKGEGQ